MVITSVEQMTPQRLTDALREAGALAQGHVTEIAAQPVGGHNMHQSVYLAVCYSEDATGAKPARLFLKLMDALTSEAKFYRHVAPRSAGLAPCYAAVYDHQRAHILLADLSATHDVPPAAVPYEEIIDFLSAFHAHWWEHPALCGEIAQIAWDPRDDVLTKARAGFSAFVDGVELTARQRAVYERVLAALPLPAWSARVAACKQVTLAHGDAHPHNFLYPRVPGGRLYAVDWAIWHIDSGASDIAYLVAVDAQAERAQMETRLLEGYHRRLLEHGIMGYDLAQCWHDYRTAIVATLPYTIFWRQVGASSDIWRGNMVNLLAAYDDLHCDDLLT